MSCRRHERRRACERKVRYASLDAAQRAAGSTSRVNARSRLGAGLREQDITLGVYRCRHCGGYHVGHEHRRESA